VFIAWYNFCRVRQTLRVTPAMQAGLTNHVWTFGELLQATAAPPITHRAPRAFLGPARF
jgi:hypothetical protein